MKRDTPLVAFVKMAWDHAGGDPHSWERFNHNVSSSIHLAASGFPWKEGDLDELMKIGSWRGRIDRCLGENAFERLYRTAVMNNNASAYTEIERFTGRAPIIADNVDGKKRGRLRLGSQFIWKGERVTVTSFNKEGKAICCTYRDTLTTDDYTRKIAKRYTVGPDDIKEARKQAKMKLKTVRR